MNEDKIQIPPYFYFKTDYAQLLDFLSDEQAGKLIKLLCNYVAKREEFPKSFDDNQVGMAATQIKQDIDKALNKYRAACENGKKGGAPKGNKNAAKKGKANIFATVKIDERSKEISYCICDVLFYEAEKTDFNITEFFSKPQLAQLAACCAIVNITGFEEYCFEYSSLKSFAMNTSAATVCREVKENTKHWYEDEGFSDFTEKFADYNQCALNLLNFPIDKIKHFSEISYNFFNLDTCSNQEFQDLQNYCTAEEFEKMKQKRNIQN